ncbi:MAG: hypothetical protein IT330_16915 [Anaerolineae bacterium]|nr:hypothetical protein [Anaerolineae bacterium]
MTGRQNVAAAFSQDGSREIPVVICYEGIYIRDHWDQLTSCPWWYQQSPGIAQQLAWRRDVFAKTGHDWFELPRFHASQDWRNLSLKVRPDGVYHVDKRTGAERKLSRPQIGGWSEEAKVQSVHPEHLADTPDEIDRLIPSPDGFAAGQVLTGSKNDLASAILKEFGETMFPIIHVNAPLWNTYSLWGFEGMMNMIGERPDLVEYACQRNLTLALRAVREAAALGAAGIWIEDCLTDLISPRKFATFNVRFLKPLVEEIRAAGMVSIHYFCGDPAGKWDHLWDVDADALSLEESKKGFAIEIDAVVERVRGRRTVLGNLDAVKVLPYATEEELRTEIARQIAAGRRNGSRFIMSIGSPVTPGTPVERVRLYCDLVRELGAA